MDRHEAILGRQSGVDGIAERPSESFEADLDEISILQADAFTEAKQAGSEIVYVYVAGTAVKLKLEVMMLNVAEAVAHLRFTSTNLL